MTPLVIALLTVGAIAALVGNIMVVVAAFRESILWGICYLLLPFASLVFLFCHWSQAKSGFLVSLFGSFMVLGGLAAEPDLRQAAIAAVTGSAANLPFELPERFRTAAAAPADLTGQIAEVRTRIETMEGQLSSGGAELSQLFTELSAKRDQLKVSSPEDVAAFNDEAARYKQRNEALKQVRDGLATARAELDELLARRAADGNRSNANLDGKTGAVMPASTRRVVMYGTKTCPACTMAKAYFAKKGVSYEEIDVNSSPAAFAEFKKLGGRGVPLILVGNQRITGFNQKALDAAL
ncbi:MAG: glutaredoxin domain-containing protein [Chthoniobacteraceae bacterium]